MAATPTIKDRLAKAVGYESDYPDDDVPSISNADPFIEREPTVGEFLAEIAPTLDGVGRYIYSLFPFIHWIGKYNVIWLIGDLVAGACPSVPPLHAHPLSFLTEGAVED